VMILRLQRERQTEAFFPSMREYAVHYGLHLRHLSLAAPDAIVMHPGPMNRGIEISSEIADGGRSLILDQVTNGVAVRMAVLYLLAGANKENGAKRNQRVSSQTAKEAARERGSSPTPGSPAEHLGRGGAVSEGSVTREKRERTRNTKHETRN